jgi:hypothetical protein
LAHVLDDDTFDEFDRGRQQLAEADKEEEVAAAVAAAVEAERAQLGAQSPELRRIARATDDILNEALIMRCPRGHAYDDFQGCCAVRCPTCNAYFCAWCGTLAANNAQCHDHVRECPEKPVGVNALYPMPRAAFDQFWLERKGNRVMDVLDRVCHSYEEKLAVWNQLAPQLLEFVGTVPGFTI